MKKQCILLVLLFSLSLPTAHAAVLHVGSGSWGDSYSTIQEAINAATAEDEIWVKQDTYPVSAYITVDKAVNLYGGFNGTETLRSQRDWAKNVTTIDGQNLATCLYITADTTVDGFTITNGNAFPPPVSSPMTDQPCGGGILKLFCKLIVANCIVKGNYADYCGGGIMNMADDLTVTNCVFSGNTADAGGAIYNAIGNVTIINSTLSGNSGTGIWNYWYEGYTCSLTIKNSILWGDSGGEIYSWSNIAVSISYSNIQGGYAGMGNINSNPLFIDPANGDYHLQSISPCIDAGDNTAVPSEFTADLDGDPRFTDDQNIADTGHGTPPIADMGAYEYASTTIVAPSSFTASPLNRAIVLAWSSKSGTDNAGFNLYRAGSEDGEYVKINPSLIPAERSSTQGASYEFVDKGVRNRETYYYKLEEIDLKGNSTMHGPVSAMPRRVFGGNR